MGNILEIPFEEEGEELSSSDEEGGPETSEDEDDGHAMKKLNELNLISEILPFDNLSILEIETIWSCFYDYAGSFAITKPELTNILINAARRLNLSCAEMSKNAESVFEVFQNSTTSPIEVMDMMEFLSAIVFISDAPLSKKIQLVFDSFDMSEDGQIDLEEFTISLKSMLVGLAKVIDKSSKIEEMGSKQKDNSELTEHLIQEIAGDIFLDMSGVETLSNNISISNSKFIDYCNASRKVQKLFFLFGSAESKQLKDIGSVEIENKSVLKRTNPLEEIDFDEAGDEFTAVKPWKGAIVAPTKFQNTSKIDSSLPLSNIKLDWVYGYRSQDCRNNLKYLKSCEILYHAAGVGIALDPKYHKQRHLIVHTDDILCLALHPDKKIVATGEQGKLPKVIVWDSSSMTVLCEMCGHHKRGITQLEFNMQGNLLAAIGLDDDHSITIYENKDGLWNNSEMKIFTKTAKIKPLDVKFNSLNNFVLVGLNHIQFWSYIKGEVANKKGIIGRKGNLQPFLCATWVDKNAIVGTADGSLYLFVGRELSKVIKGHKSAINAIDASETTIVTGCKDGVIIVWNTKLKKVGGPFSVSSFSKCQHGSIRSVCISQTAPKLLVGTFGSEIYEISLSSGEDLNSGALMQSHFAGELWGLSVHPLKNEVCTVGEDMRLRIWDTTAKKQIECITLDSKAKSCAYSPDGKYLAVGVNGKVKDKKNKTGFIILSRDGLCKLYEKYDIKKPISDIKFSPDGNILAVGSHDTNINFYDGKNNFAKKKTFSKHTSYITHFDFSEDGKFLQSNCGGYELLFCDTTTGGQITSASSLRDIEWNSWTCVLGWPVQGIWPPCSDGTDINAVDRSNRCKDKIATGDDFGKVKVFRYPCVEEKKAQFIELCGHSSHVTNVRWLFDDSSLLSVGGGDRCLFQWKHDVEQEETADEVRNFDNDVIPCEVASSRKNEDQVDLFEMEGGGDEFMAVKPWVGAIVAPSNAGNAPECLLQPDVLVEINWVHGYESENARNNVHYLATGVIVYHVAALGIVCNCNSSPPSQKHYKGHDDDIVCLTVHPKGDIAASGQLGKVPSIHVWKVSDSGDPCNVSTISGLHQRSVSILSFSKSGEELASVGGDDDHSILIYKWEDGTLIAKSKGDRNPTIDLAYSNSNGIEWITCGVKHIYFWSCQGRNLSKKKGILGKKGKIQAFLCIASLSNATVIGTECGELYVFNSHNLGKTLKGHNKAVTALYYNGESPTLISGGKDGKVILWSLDLKQLCQINLEEFDIRNNLHKNKMVKSISTRDNNLMLVGTRGSDIIQFSFSSDSGISRTKDTATIITHGHSTGELWGLAVNPTKDEYCTVGDDKMLIIWDIKSNAMVKRVQLMDSARTCSYSPDGSLIAVGFGGPIRRGKSKAKAESKEGSIIVLEEETLKTIFEDKPAKEWNSIIRFSPNGKLLAVGSHDNAIYFYGNLKSSGFKKRGKPFRKHNSYITHFDFSKDGNFIQSNCGAYELLFCDANTGKQITSASSLKDTEWQTWSCTLGWPVQGIWPACSDGTDVNAVSRSFRGDLLASGDDFGKVKIFRYPCVSSGTCDAIELSGHSSHVSNISWSNNDSFVLSVGGNDRSIIQWNVTKQNTELVESTSLEGTVALDVDPDNPEVEFDLDAEGDEFLAVKPWVGAIAAPSNPPASNSREPDVTPDIDWVYGCGKSVFYSVANEVVYYAAALGIIYDSTTHVQKYHFIHSDDIISMSVSLDRRFAVTGEMGKKPSARVWCTESGKCLSTLSGYHARGIPIVSFSKDGKRICTVGSDDNHSLGIWEDTTGAWTAGKLISSSKGDRNKTFFGAYSDEGNYQWITGGARHVMFWKVEGKKLSSKKGMFGKKGTMQNMFCALSFNGKILTGAEDGSLYQWVGNEVHAVHKAHGGRVNSLFYSNNKNVLVSGANDGKIILWDKDLQQLSTIDVSQSGESSKVRSVCLSSDDMKLLFCTYENEIFELIKGTSDGKFCMENGKCLINGHFAGEVWGLAVHPNQPVICSVGDDKTAKLWDTKEKRLIKSLSLKVKARACAFSNDGKYLAIGLGAGDGKKGKQIKDGGIMVLKADDHKLVFTHKPSKEWISDIKFSPNNNLLAVGSHDNYIYFYKVEGEQFTFLKKKTFKKHSSYITHFDFSVDGSTLQSNCGAYEYLFCNTETGSHITSASSVKDTKWYTWTCTLGWPVQGIWPECADGTDINAVCVSKSGNLLATSDDHGKLKLFRYPCITKGAKFTLGLGHSSHVTNVRFSRDDRLCFTTGGNDRAVIQWRLSV